MNDYNLTEVEKEAVTTQLSYRIGELEKLMCVAGSKNDTKRVMELAEYIKNLKSGFYKLLKID